MSNTDVQQRGEAPSAATYCWAALRAYRAHAVRAAPILSARSTLRWRGRPPSPSARALGLLEWLSPKVALAALPHRAPTGTARANLPISCCTTRQQVRRAHAGPRRDSDAMSPPFSDAVILPMPSSTRTTVLLTDSLPNTDSVALEGVMPVRDGAYCCEASLAPRWVRCSRYSGSSKGGSWSAGLRTAPGPRLRTWV